jgi:hypothetical protein
VCDSAIYARQSAVGSGGGGGDVGPSGVVERVHIVLPLPIYIIYTYTYIQYYTHTHTHTHIHIIALYCRWMYTRASPYLANRRYTRRSIIIQTENKTHISRAQKYIRLTAVREITYYYYIIVVVVHLKHARTSEFVSRPGITIDRKSVTSHEDIRIRADASRTHTRA